MTLTYNPTPCDEPPPASLRTQAQRHADNTGEAVTIQDRQGRVFGVYEAEV